MYFVWFSDAFFYTFVLFSVRNFDFFFFNQPSKPSQLASHSATGVLVQRWNLNEICIISTCNLNEIYIKIVTEFRHDFDGFVNFFSNFVDENFLQQSCSIRYLIQNQDFGRSYKIDWRRILPTTICAFEFMNFTVHQNLEVGKNRRNYLLTCINFGANASARKNANLNRGFWCICRFWSNHKCATH